VAAEGMVSGIILPRVTRRLAAARPGVVVWSVSMAIVYVINIVFAIDYNVDLGRYWHQPSIRSPPGGGIPVRRAE
jgi:hypothetical protein